jgi:hypothetical protein
MPCSIHCVDLLVSPVTRRGLCVEVGALVARDGSLESEVHLQRLTLLLYT